MRNEKGFTLIELLVVVIIIGVLAALAVPIYIGVQNSAKDSAVRSDLTNARVALVSYYTEHDAYPASLDGLNDYGYAIPSTDNYTALPSIEFNHDSSRFCLIATSSTQNKWGSSDTGGTEEAAACEAGVFTAKT